MTSPDAFRLSVKTHWQDIGFLSFGRSVKHHVFILRNISISSSIAIFHLGQSDRVLASNKVTGVSSSFKLLCMALNMV